MRNYDFTSIEEKWRRYWKEREVFRAPGPGEPGFDPARPKAYVLDMFPYPSGAGLHVGHPLGYIATDIVSRFKRMRGFNVLHPMGYDAFGLPAEQYAIETGTHPRVTTEANIQNFRRQLEACGLSVDWNRELATTDVAFYRWTQWIFLRLFHAYVDPRTGTARLVAELEPELEADQARVTESGELVFREGTGTSAPSQGTSPRGAPSQGAPSHGTPSHGTPTYGTPTPGTPTYGTPPRSAMDAATASAAFESAPRWRDLDARARQNALFGLRLAYIDEVPVNWCPALGTVLANEEVTSEGRSERGNHPVVRRPLRQWMLRITAFADRLLDDLQQVDWPEPTKLMQRNWIGRSEGARVVFPVEDADRTIEVFTTRPDTLFGATYMVLAPEHPLVDEVTTLDHQDEVAAYRTASAQKSEIDRQESKEKTGVFTGGHATNPVSGERIPIWVADYVLMGYGTGAIMAVPAHDSRDFEFAKRFELPIRAVIEPPEEWIESQAAAGGAPDPGGRSLREIYLETPERFAEAFGGDGVGRASRNDGVSLDGVPTPEAKHKIVAWLESEGLGRGEVQYKLRDWLFSRQRYWGEPFPILHGEDGEVVALDESELPVELPPLDDFRPVVSDDPEAPPQFALSRADKSWRIVERNGKRYEREVNTMPQWAGSCWYYLRYLDPHNDQAMVDPEKERYWMQPNGVDLYMGGVEHAVLHLLYARFWHKVLFDLGHVSTAEPFARLYNQGYIQAYSYQDRRGIYVDASQIEEREGRFFFQGEEVMRSQGKMGKSLKNAVSPDQVLAEYGCDCLRLYEMYLGPIDQSKVWSTHAIVGIFRFLQRTWRNFVDEEGALRVVEEAPDDELRRRLHRTIADVTEDMEHFRFNTAIAKLIELNNALVARETLPREVAEAMLLMLAPQAPFLAEELWERLGHTESIGRAAWPTHDPALLVADEKEIVVQVMGKKRGSVVVPADADETAVEAAALADETVQRHLGGKTVRKVIHVKGKLVNIVAN